MVLSRFRQAIAARKANAGGDRPDLSRHAARIIDEMAAATFVLDRDGRVALWNEACARLTGLEAAKVIGAKDHWQGFYLAARPCLAKLAKGDLVARVETELHDEADRLRLDFNAAAEALRAAMGANAERRR
jgi:PAS domain-containing protein